jgi:hypothetical protein
MTLTLILNPCPSGKDTSLINLILTRILTLKVWIGFDQNVQNVQNESTLKYSPGRQYLEFFP